MPKEGNFGLNKLQLEKNLVMSWLLNTMTNDIGENFMYGQLWKKTPKIWEAVKKNLLKYG